jgi:predicted XRE-type DNA-binding protein
MFYELELNSVDLERFWNKVEVKGEDDCWNWVRRLSEDGYGQYTFHGSSQIASRVSYFIHHGPFEKKLFVCHSCDNRKCVNPNHLWLGTHQDNMDDMVNKKRSISHKGENNLTAKLKKEDIVKIRELFAQNSFTQRELAVIYNVSASNISIIVQGMTWKDEGGPITNLGTNTIKYTAKITKEDATKIRILYKEGSTYKELAKIYNLSESGIHDIVKRVTWKDAE